MRQAVGTISTNGFWHFLSLSLPTGFSFFLHGDVDIRPAGAVLLSVPFYRVKETRARDRLLANHADDNFHHRRSIAEPTRQPAKRKAAASEKVWRGQGCWASSQAFNSQFPITVRLRTHRHSRLPATKIPHYPLTCPRHRHPAASASGNLPASTLPCQHLIALPAFNGCSVRVSKRKATRNMT